MNKIMSKILMVGILLLCTLACKNNSNKRKDIYKDGKLIKTIVITSDTTFYNIEYYENGDYSSIASFDSKSLLKDGLYMSFYESGMIEEKGFFKKNKKHGEWRRYTEEGLLIEKSQLVALDYDEYPMVSENIYYNEYMELDTTKQLLYIETKSFTDTIYEREPYLLKIKLHQPYFKDGSMSVILVDNFSDYYDLSKVELVELISCEGFEHLFQIKDHHIGNNQINGVVIHYDKTGRFRIPYYFSKDFYVKGFSSFGL